MSRLLSFLFALFFLNAGAQVTDEQVNYVQPADSVIVLNEIRVVAYRGSGRLLKVPGSLSVLTNEGLMISDGTSLAATLNTLPGVNMQTGTFLTSRIVIRGMGSRTPYNTNRIRTYLNDIPLTTADGVSTPEEIDLLSLDKVEVIKGPSSALYGSGLGGSINMYSRQKADNEGTLDAQYGSFNTFKGHLSGTIKTGNASLWGSISHLNSDGYRENNHYKRTSFITTTRWEKSDWSVNSTLLLIDVDGGIPSSLGKTLFENNPRAAAPNWKATGGYKKYRKAIAAVTLTNNLSDRITNSFTLFGKWNDNYEKRPFNNLDDQSLSGGMRNKLSHHTRKSDLTAGFEWIPEQYRWRLDNNNVLLNENSETRFLMNIFAMALLKPTPKLNISLAGAMNRIS